LKDIESGFASFAAIDFEVLSFTNQSSSFFQHNPHFHAEILEE
jgi:hypothetical protein